MGILQFKADKTAYLESAEKADREGNPLQAMALLRRAEELDPHDFDIKSRMAAVLIGMGLPDIAEDLLFSYVACERKPPREAYLLLLHLLLDGGEYLLAEGVITETVGAGDDPMALLTELYGLIEKERYEGPNLRLLGDGYTLNRVEELAAAEVRSYLGRILRYGVPLDNRKPYTKADWVVWAASLARERIDFEHLIAPLYRFLDETPSRIPFGDWYGVTDGLEQGFRARSVVGGVFLPFLSREGGGFGA